MIINFISPNLLVSIHGNFFKTSKSFALHLNFCPMRAAVTFFLFAYPYYLVMPAQKKSNQKTLVQKKVTEWYSFAVFE
jgi:hypothetical protein